MTDNRRTAAGFALTPFLPLVLMALLLGAAVLIALVAPSRVTSGVYQVVVLTEERDGNLSVQFEVPTESLTCSRNGRVATCTTPPVAGEPIETTLTYDEQWLADPRTLTISGCVAEHGERRLPCRSVADYGQASHSVHITEWLDVGEVELTRLREAVPWWRTSDLMWNGLLLIGGLAVLAGVAGYFLGGRATPQVRRSRVPITIGTALLGLWVFNTGSTIIASGPWHNTFFFWVYLVNPFGLISLAALAAWQYKFCDDGRSRRVRYAVGAALAAAIYSFVALFVFLLASGFID